jgi:hypothetical protein
MTLLGRRFSVSFVTLVAMLVAAVPALAYICHPDPTGTRTLLVNGRVMAYSLHGRTIDLSLRDKAGCTRVVSWSPLNGATLKPLPQPGHQCKRGGMRPPVHPSVEIPRQPDPYLQTSAGERRAVLGADGVIEIFRGTTLLSRFDRVGSAPAQALALSGDRLVVLAAGSAPLDRPARFEVYNVRSGSLLHVWPLFVRPLTLDLYGGVALFSAASGGVFGLRLTDGLATSFGPVQRHDMPQIGQFGVVFQSNLSERLNRQGQIAVKFLPTRTVRAAFTKTRDTLVTRWPIRDFSMDGHRVAVLLDAPHGLCDEVRIWSIPWHWLGRINMQEDLTCSRDMEIRSVALGAIRTEWVATKRGTAKVIYTDGKKCIEEVLATARSARGILIAGDHHLLAFLSPHSRSESHDEEAVVNLRSGAASSGPGAALGISLDNQRAAVLRRDGRVNLLSSSGKLIGTVAPTSPTAIALRGERLVALTQNRTLEVWNATSGRLENAWPIPAAVEPRLDVHYGIAVFTTKRSVYALLLESGRIAVLARTQSGVRAQIEEAGVVYRYNARQDGFMRFIPLATVEGALGGAQATGRR